MFKRNCPKCSKEIVYKTKNGLNNCIKANSYCKSCTFGGKNNGFYGKNHTETTKQKIKDNNKKNKDVWKTEEFRQKMSKVTSGSNNPNYGVSNYSRWLEKYGKIEADKRLQEYKEKQSKLNSGESNPMYGKPSPKGSGVGWKGWYKNHFFRSLRELTFMLEMEENKIQWKSAESIRIKYKCPLGNNRTYSPDFLVGNRLIEIKPVRLQESPSVLLKTEAGKRYCEENNLLFEIVDVDIDSVLIDKYMSDIKFTDNYKEKYKKYKETK